MLPKLHVLALVVLSGCAPRGAAPNALPEYVLGAFTDDYGSAYVISEQMWEHRGYARYHVVRWRPEAGYLIAQNDASNPTGSGLWTRIDWVRLDGMPPWGWAFCLSAYEAPSFAAAESTLVARPSRPRTGCNGHPFTRMRRDGTGGPGEPGVRQ